MSLLASRRTSVAVAGVALATLAGGLTPLLAACSASPAATEARTAGTAGPAAVTAPLKQHPQGRQPRPNGSVELTWAPTYMQRGPLYVTKAQAVALAKRFNLIASLPVTFKSYVPAMKAANPDLTVIAYANATFLSDHRPAPAAEYARDVNGNLIRSTGFLTHLMNPGNSDWRTHATQICQTAATGYDGCLIDMLTMGIYSKNYVSALPVDPATKQLYTQDQWRSQLVALSHAYVDALPSKIIIGNSVSNSGRFWAKPSVEPNSQPMVGALPGSQMEDFLRGATDPYNAFPSPHAWLQNIRVIHAIEESGRTGLYSTKVWPSPSRAVAARWDAYAMASFLLEADGHSYFAFTDSRTEQGTIGRPPYTMPRRLGNPTGHVHRKGRVYLRHFQHGLSVVNPSDRTVHLHLHHHYRNLQGHRITRLTLHAHSGNVLLR